MTFSEIINDYKNKNQFTHEGVAEKIGVSKVTVSNWITGRSAPDLKDSDIINAIASKTNISPKDIVLSIIEQNGVDFTIPEMPINPYYKYFGTKFTDSLALSEAEAIVFLLIADKCCGSNVKQYSHPVNSIYKNESYISIYEQDSYNLMVEQYVMGVLSSCIEEVEVEQAYEIIQKVIALKNKINSETVDFINDYLKAGHKTFDPKRLTDEELYQFLSSTNNLNQDSDILRNYVDKDGHLHLISQNSNNCQFEPYIQEILDNECEKLEEDFHLGKFNHGGCFILTCLDEYETMAENADKPLSIDEHDVIECAYEAVREQILPFDKLQSYIVQLVKYDEAEVESYKQLYEAYEKEVEIYNAKMEEIRKLQYLYDKEKYPDLPAPVPPEKPSEKYFYTLSKKGEKLLEFYNATNPIIEPSSEEKASDYRYALEKHIGNEVILDAVYAKAEEDNVVIRDIYLNDDYVSDHLHIFKGNEFFKEKKIGMRLNVKGTVYEYTNSNGLKNLGIKVTNLA